MESSCVTDQIILVKTLQTQFKQKDADRKWYFMSTMIPVNTCFQCEGLFDDDFIRAYNRVVDTPCNIGVTEIALTCQKCEKSVRKFIGIDAATRSTLPSCVRKLSQVVAKGATKVEKWQIEGIRMSGSLNEPIAYLSGGPDKMYGKHAIVRQLLRDNNLLANELSQLSSCRPEWYPVEMWSAMFELFKLLI